MKKTRDIRYIPKIKLWHLQGNVYLWHYLEKNKGMSGWHFWATEDAYKSLITLIDIMLDPPKQEKKQIPLTPPTPDVIRHADPNCPWEAAETLILHLCPEEALDYWNLRLEQRSLILSCGISNIVKLRESLERALKADYDFCISPSKLQKGHEPMLLWFW